MKEEKVKDVMVPLEEYATVFEDATLYEAVQALERAQTEFCRNKYRHRAVLVKDQSGQVIGKLSQLDVLKGLEPGYKKMGDLSRTTWLGFRSEFISSTLREYGLWQRPLEDICKKATSIKVKDIMYTPTEGEYVDENASLDTAIHQLVVGHHQSLLVLRGKAVVGILRLSDVFAEVCAAIAVCKL